MPRPTRIRVLGCSVCGALAALGVFVATSVGNPSNSFSKSASATGWASVRPTASAAAGGKYKYVEVTGHVAGGQFITGTIKCPKAFPHAVGGFFDSNSVSVFESTSRPGTTSTSNWVVGLTNTGSATANVIAGAVCAG